MPIPRVAIIEATDSLRMLYRFHLQQLGCEVVEARAFHTAWEMLQTDRAFDVLFASMVFPYEQGLHFVLKVKTVFPDLQIVAVCALKQDRLPMTQAIRVSVAECMYAPVSRQEFQQVLQKLNVL